MLPVRRGAVARGRRRRALRGPPGARGAVARPRTRLARALRMTPARRRGRHPAGQPAPRGAHACCLPMLDALRDGPRRPREHRRAGPGRAQPGYGHARVVCARCARRIGSRPSTSTPGAGAMHRAARLRRGPLRVGHGVARGRARARRARSSPTAWAWRRSSRRARWSHAPRRPAECAAGRARFAELLQRDVAPRPARRRPGRRARPRPRSSPGLRRVEACSGRAPASSVPWPGCSLRGSAEPAPPERLTRRGRRRTAHGAGRWLPSRRGARGPQPVAATRSASETRRRCTRAMRSTRSPRT